MDKEIKEEVFTLEEVMKLLKCNRYQVMKYKDKYCLPLRKYKNNYVIKKKDLGIWQNRKDEVEKQILKNKEKANKGILIVSLTLLYLVVLIISFTINIILTAVCLLFLVGLGYHYAHKEKQKELTKENINLLVSKYKEMTISDYKRYKQENKEEDFSGIYIFYNTNKNKYYVGQSIHVNDRINDHLIGNGCRTLYIDTKCGDEITIKMIKLEDTNYETLNQLERDTILTLDGFETGYNKNRGVKN